MKKETNFVRSLHWQIHLTYPTHLNLNVHRSIQFAYLVKIMSWQLDLAALDVVCLYSRNNDNIWFRDIIRPIEPHDIIRTVSRCFLNFLILECKKKRIFSGTYWSLHWQIHFTVWSIEIWDWKCYSHGMRPFPALHHNLQYVCRAVPSTTQDINKRPEKQLYENTYCKIIYGSFKLWK